MRKIWFYKGADKSKRDIGRLMKLSVSAIHDAIINLWRVGQLCFFYVQIQPKLKKIFVLKDVDLICWGIIKVKKSLQNFWDEV